MKAVYDKLLFVLALLILAGSVVYFFFVVKKEPATAGGGGNALLTQAPTGGAYESVPVPHFERQEIPWPAPKPQDAEGNWLFDVFTPPRIYWDPVAKKLVSEPWQPPEEAPPFALELVAIEQQLFRVQLEAYFTGASGKPEDTIIQFVDVEKDASFRGTVGKTFDDHKVRIDNFEIKRDFNPDGSVTTNGIAVVTDLNTDTQFTLVASQKLYIPGKFTISMRSTPPLPVETFEWKGAGEKKEVGNATFVLDSYDLEAKTVTVTKTAPNLPEPETKTLDVTAPAPAAAPAVEAEGGVGLPPQNQNFLDNLFR